MYSDRIIIFALARLSLRAAFIITLILPMLVAVPEAAAQNKPNIVFILTDDVGWGDLKPFNPNSQLNLPTIETLAAEGIVFTDAHTSAAKCAPSRYSIISGNYQWRGRFGWGQWNYKGGSQVLAGQETLGDVLSQAGYATAFIGKSHLGGHFYLKNSNNFVSGNAPDSDVDFGRIMSEGPLEIGFDRSFIALRGIQASPYAFFEDDRLLGDANSMIQWNAGDYGDTEIAREGIGLPSWNTRAVGPTLVEKAVNFIDAHHQENVDNGTSQPFFLY
jgi:arylsulfatase A-like enzyme